MKKLIIALGVSALTFAFTDAIHGQHNGDAHRFYIHIAEFVSFLSFLSLLEIQAFRLLTDKLPISRWLASFSISLVSFLVGSAIFALAGGSAHGDGGPIAVNFALIASIGALGMVISLVGFASAMVLRRSNGSSVS